MDKDTRNAIERATQRLRTILEADFAQQLYGDFDVDPNGGWAEKAGRHLSVQRAVHRGKIIAALEHKRAAGLAPVDCVADYLRDAAFTALNRFVALKMLEARELVQECISRGEESSGYREFCGLAPGVNLLPDAAGYRLYIESLFDELSTEIKVLFDRRDPASVLWPKRATFEELLQVLNAPALTSVWREDETIGWVYQYFNSEEDRRKARYDRHGKPKSPQNARELAVRNQFFTPRYVVEFLTDNTLGRIWYEMQGTRTALAERCAYLVRRSGEVLLPRDKKDPRDLKILDPACGSGHFLLYAFELLIAIYEEAQADPEAPRSEATGRTLREDYPTREVLQRDLPALILAHNLHGVDIDARCAQIAQLGLWMRAQRAYRDFGIGRKDRRRIRRSNIVVAEPLVSDDRRTEELVARLGDPALGRVFRELSEALKLAGDLGILLRVERLLTRTSKSGQIDYLEPPEERIRDALHRFVAEEGTRLTMRRRLFADDAVQGLGLLEMAENSFDVVLMNPPFGPESTESKKDFEKLYPRSKTDIFAAFVERGIELLHSHGVLGAITSRTGFFLPSFQQWREGTVLIDAPPLVFADLGLGVMDAALVEAAAYCLEKGGNSANRQTIFLRTLEEKHNKASVLLDAITRPEVALGRQRFELEASRFSMLSRSPFAYWVTDAIRKLFISMPSLESSRRTAKVGIQSSDDFRFLRLWWEIGAERQCKWLLFAKGGSFSTFYADIFLCVNWENDGAEIRNFCRSDSDRVASRPQNTSYFGRRGLTWPHRTKSELGFRVLPPGCAFGHKGPSLFVEGDSPIELLTQLAICASAAFRALVELQVAAAEPTGRGGAARSYDVGILQRTPIPIQPSSADAALTKMSARGWALRRQLDTRVEASHAFVLPSGLNERITGLDRAAIETELVQIQRQIDDRAFELYGIGPEDRAVIQSADRTEAVGDGETAELDQSDDEDEVDADAETVDTGEQAAVMSWLVGVAFGRFDPRLATGEREVPPEPEPFDPLPARSPGMWPEGEAPMDAPDILVDDEGHGADLAARVREIADRIHWAPPENLRAWLARAFFPLHIKMYSKSRRKAPIYWQLATPSGRYSVWLYLHAMTRDTLFRVQHEYADPKLLHEEQRLESMRGEFGENPSRTERRQLEAQESLVAELRTFLEEVARIAPLWNPNLDDGVVINFAPLWRLVRQCVTWQRELKTTWDALCGGKYDWAHLAMHLWPERVVPKCARDRSLAIAHGLEEIFWVENGEGQWVARETPTRSIAELVRERTSSAVKAALESLLNAPVMQGGGRPRTRRARATGNV